MRRTRFISTFVAGLVFLSLGLATPAHAQLTNRSGSRLRLGIEAGFGPNRTGDGGVLAGAFGQLGVQFNSHFALYYQPSFTLVVAGTTRSDRLLANTDHLVLTDATVGPFQFGLGAGVSLVPRAACQASVACASSAIDVHPAVGGRIAVVIEAPGLRARWGVPIAANLHIADPASGSRATSLIITIGIQRY